MIAITCKNGNAFSAIVDEHADAEWKLEELYYKDQGCIVVKSESIQLKECTCDHCKSLEHEAHTLVEDIKNPSDALRSTGLGLN
jgi:phage portal protein BeeE